VRYGLKQKMRDMKIEQTNNSDQYDAERPGSPQAYLLAHAADDITQRMICELKPVRRRHWEAGEYSATAQRSAAKRPRLPSLI
jgi:hypothetical protein